MAIAAKARTDFDAGMHRCRCCGSAIIDEPLRLPAVPVCNRFTRTAADQDLFELSLGQCVFCALIQIIDGPPPAAITPRVAWIAYNEPSAHLDEVTERLATLLPVDAPTVLGLGPFDSPLIERLRKNGVNATALNLLDLIKEAHPAGKRPYLETWQALLAKVDAERIASLGAPVVPDMVVLRYLLEHCENPIDSLRAIAALLSPAGHLIVEVPDCSKFLSRMDYSFIWEEHILYFVEDTLRQMMAQSGLQALDVWRYSGEMEDALVVVAKRAPNVALPKAPSSDIFTSYRDGFVRTKNAVRRGLTIKTKPGSKTALFGAGHQAMMFANLFDLHDHIDMIVDDDASKIGTYAPGAHAPIVGLNEMLENREVGTCLAAIAPSVVRKIEPRLQPFYNRGGKVYSIFPGLNVPTLTDCHENPN